MRTHEAATGRELLSDSVVGGIVGGGLGALMGYGVVDAGLRGARHSRNSLIKGLARNKQLRRIVAGGAGSAAALGGGMAGSIMMGGQTWFQGVPKQASVTEDAHVDGVQRYLGEFSDKAVKREKWKDRSGLALGIAGVGAAAAGIWAGRRLKPLTRFGLTVGGSAAALGGLSWSDRASRRGAIARSIHPNASKEDMDRLRRVAEISSSRQMWEADREVYDGFKDYVRQKRASAVGTGKLGLGCVGSAGNGVVKELIHARIGKKAAIETLRKSASVLPVSAGKPARAVKPETIAKAVKAMKPMPTKIAVDTIQSSEVLMRYEYVKKGSTGSHGGMSGMGVTGSGSSGGMATGKKKFVFRKKAADGEKVADGVSGDLEGDDGAFSRAFAAFIAHDIGVDRKMLTRSGPRGS